MLYLLQGVSLASMQLLYAWEVIPGAVLIPSQSASVA